MNSSARIGPDLWVSRTTSPAIAGVGGLVVAYSLLTSHSRPALSRFVVGAGAVVALSTIRALLTSMWAG